MNRLKELAGPIVSHCAHVQYAHTCTYMYDMTCIYILQWTAKEMFNFVYVSSSYSALYNGTA